MKKYIYGKNSKVYYGMTTDPEKAQKMLKDAKRAYPYEEWVIIKEHGAYGVGLK